VGCRPQCRYNSCHRLAQRLGDTPGRDVLGATVDDVELLEVLSITGLRVEVAVDDLDLPLGALELDLLLVIALTGNVLLAILLAWRHTNAARLLVLLLVDLLPKLLDLPALLGVGTPQVVHQAPRPALVAAGGLAQLLVVVWAVAPTNRCCDNSSSGSTCHQLVVVVGLLLLLPILVLATALRSDICFRLVGLPCLWSSDALVRQAEELRDVIQLVGGQLLKHLLISHALSKNDNNRSIGDVGDGVSNLGEPLDEGPQ
jgi:hypothetical protein